jgi:hypothetical protein
MLCSDLNATQIGTVGEQLVRYKLLRWGYQAIPVEQGNDYDIIVLAKKPIRIQVKSTKSVDPSKPNSYRFNTKKGSQHHKVYCESTIDSFAFVALDTERVVFFPYLDTTCKRISASKYNELDEYQSWLSIIDIIANK